MQRRYTYTVKIRKSDEGGYIATVPILPGCHTQGDTYEEALAYIEKAIQGHTEFLQKLGRPVPVETDHRELHVQVSLPMLA
ncbi:MAG: type II toxin-antitoxin system HicB family antitoxin [Opitutaceae bacterium]|nr:type II toxin-antitoxin system HicB family antitoxin [Opitutaceae bacterium]